VSGVSPLATLRARRLALLATAAGLALAALAALIPAPADAALPGFVARCPGTHRAPDDPIVAPRRPGRAHLHDFYGNRSTDAFTTTASLRRGATSCRPSTDRSAYWAPTLFDRGRVVRAARAAFHFDATTVPRSAIRPFPLGLKVIAGDARRRAPGPAPAALWSCPLSSIAASQSFPVCPDGFGLGVTVRFPDCWNGRTLDSPDHHGHMAYSRGGRCPRTHPVPVPRLRVELRYRARGGPGFFVASGPAPSTHSDFFNAWDPAALASLVRTCLHAAGRCPSPG